MGGRHAGLGQLPDPVGHPPGTAAERAAIMLAGVRINWILPFFLAACATSPPPANYVVESAASIDASATELIILRDEAGGIEAAVSPSRGGELAGLRVLHGGAWLETLQLARDYSPREGFGGKGPFLWPATGRSFPPDLEERRKAGESFERGAYVHGGVRREMPIHGFARDLPWQLEEAVADAGSARALLSLHDDSETREMYPVRIPLQCRVRRPGRGARTPLSRAGGRRE